MASTVRRDTYVLDGIESSNGASIHNIPNSMEISRRERQNLMRLRINRIALVSEIKVDHLVPILLESGVLTETDKQRISSGSTIQDKARLLIDILPKKSNVDWYAHLKYALLNSLGDSDAHKRYQILVEFLENTFIPQPNSTPLKISLTDSQIAELKFPKYDKLPEIAKNEDDQNLNQSNQSNPSESSTIEKKEENSVNILVIEINKVDKVLENNGEVEKGVKEDVPETENKLTQSADNGDCDEEVPKFSEENIKKPDDWVSKLEIPEKLLKILDKSQDKEQLEEEKQVLERIENLEIILAAKEKSQLPENFEISMSEAFNQILLEQKHYHYYVKYFRILTSVPKEIISSYSSVLVKMEKYKKNEEVDDIIKKGFLLADFLVELSLMMEAEVITIFLLNFLHTDDSMNTWMAKYHASVKLTQIHNKNYNFSAAEQDYFLAVQMTWPIKLMSFGKNLVEEGDLLIELSHYQLEQGSISSGYGWAKKALQELSSENHTGIVNGLCNGVMAFCSKLQVKKARDIAIQAVLHAKTYFGTRHPLYLKALLHLCHFTSEFVYEEITVEIAEMTLELAMKMYGCECLQVALAHRALSKALMLLHRFDSDRYYDHAMESIRIARSLFTNDHSMLHLFLHTFASALQWKALNSPEEVKDSTLHWAETEAKHALKITKSCYGEISLRTAQMYSLLGQIYSKIKSHPDPSISLPEEAERNLKKCVSDMKLCQSPKSQFYLLSLATLGIYYTVENRPEDSLRYLHDVIDNIESYGYYIWWIHACYTKLIESYTILEDKEAADLVNQQLDIWLADNPKHDRLLTLSNLEDQALPFVDILEQVDVWGSKLKKVRVQLEENKEFIQQ